MKEKTVLFLSVLVPKEMQKEVYEKNIGTAQDAGTLFQYRIIRGLDENLDIPVTLCNLLPVSSYPKYYREPIIKRIEFEHSRGANDVSVGFLNIAYIKRLFISYSYKHELIRVLKNKKFSYVICYSANPALLTGLKYIKRKHPDMITCVIIPDMPEFNDLSEQTSSLYRWYMRQSAKKFRDVFQYIDSFVYMTEQSASYLNTGKPYIVMEGISEVSDLTVIHGDTRRKIILYSGTTNRQFGIPTLIEAFQAIEKEEYELVICGCGDYDDEIRKAALLDSRITFRGVVPHDEVISLQRRATILINPRQNIGDYTKYSFPSKTMEYLASGVPVLAYKLDGISEEYDQYIQYVSGNDAESLKTGIISACEEPVSVRLERGCRARSFVKQYKSAEYQTCKILDMLTKVEKEKTN